MSNYMLAGFKIGMGLFFEVLAYFSWGFRFLSEVVGYSNRETLLKYFLHIEGLGIHVYGLCVYIYFG